MNKIKKMMLALTMCLFAGSSAVPVYAMTEEPIVEMEANIPLEEEEAADGPLTPNGNLTLVDDYGKEGKSGKQFVTLVSKNGNYFYLIIDRDDSGNETVHFLNQVDESDLFALMEEEEVEAYLSSKVKPEQEAVAEPTPTSSPVIVEEAPKEKKPYGILILFLLLSAGGVLGYLYLHASKQKKQEVSYEDPDADYEDDTMEEYMEEEEDLQIEENEEEEPYEEDGFYHVEKPMV